HVPDDAEAPVESREEPPPVWREHHHAGPVIAGFERQELLAGLDIKQSDRVLAERVAVPDVRGRQESAVEGKGQPAAGRIRLPDPPAHRAGLDVPDVDPFARACDEGAAVGTEGCAPQTRLRRAPGLLLLRSPPFGLETALLVAGQRIEADHGAIVQG